MLSSPTRADTEPKALLSSRVCFRCPCQGTVTRRVSQMAKMRVYQQHRTFLRLSWKGVSSLSSFNVCRQ